MRSRTTKKICLDGVIYASTLIVMWVMPSVARVAHAAAPILYQHPFHQSPVRAAPDDLLMLGGSNFSGNDVVVYRLLGNTTHTLTPPTSVPNTSTFDQGTAEVVSYTNIPDSLTVRLPLAMRADNSYALWVRNVNGEWSNGVKINDARPLWVTPAVAYRTVMPAGLPRQLKIVGRNLQSIPTEATRVKLINASESYNLKAVDDANPNTAIEHYVARVNLPDEMVLGKYQVQVSRDGTSWVPLQGLTLEVLEDPLPPAATFNITSYGCSPNDGLDDTACIVAAVNAATGPRGTVIFPQGQWELINDALTGQNLNHGIVVPPGVNLLGAGSAETNIVKNASWTARRPAFTLQGYNTVSNFGFKDGRIYEPTDRVGSFFQLGKVPWDSNPGPSPVQEIEFTKNVFNGPFIAISGALPVRRLFIVNNEFGAYFLNIYLSGNRNLPNVKLRVDDSVIAHNVFKPGSYFQPEIVQGTIASALGASYRVDFSNNVADGRDATYLASGAVPGWRAAFFWHMSNNQEMLLVSQNSATCTGDKGGDGESFSFDNNANTFGFPEAASVLSATSNTITLAGPLQTVQYGKEVPADYYNEHWIQLANGAGLGQTRKIVSYSTDPSNAQITFTVTPAWDVVPQPSNSKATVARQFWQMYTVDNYVDNRNVTNDDCAGTSPNKVKKYGLISLYGMMADGAVEGNIQHQSDGVLLSGIYSNHDPVNGLIQRQDFKYFVEIRGNTLNGEYDYNTDCSWSGISLWHGAATAALPEKQMPPSPVVHFYGVSIAANSLAHADAIRGGAISFADTWWVAPNSRIALNTLVQHNRILDMPNTAFTNSVRCDNANIPRSVGINIRRPETVNTILYGNTFDNSVVSPLLNKGTNTIQVQ